MFSRFLSKVNIKQYLLHFATLRNEVIVQSRL